MTTGQKLHFLIIDDDKVFLQLYTALLEQAGHKVTATSSSTDALAMISNLQPDCVLSDLMLPDLDGLDLYQQVRKIQTIKQPSFIIITGKSYDFDRRRALQLGVDGYIVKPINPDTFVNEIIDIITDNMVLQFWGVRGTLPVPGEKTIYYGGNTNCISLNIAKKHFFIFDAGSGIKALSNYLIKENKLPISAKIFISHPHWDHINGIPFFVPLYIKGNEFEVLGANHGDIGIEKLISDQMNSIYFPVTTSEFMATLKFRNLNEEKFYIDDISIQTILLNHPGRCLGYRIQYKEKSFCYITDNELYLENSPNYNEHYVKHLIEFIRETDVLVIDTTYSDEEYIKKVNWGHSCTSRVIDLADKANVKLLCLFHHDPDQMDKDIDNKLTHAKELLRARHSKTHCIAPRENDTILI